MKKTLLCATAVAAFASAGLVAQAEEGWYGRADVGYVFSGKLDHDPERDVLHTMGGDSDSDEMWLGDLGLGYGFDNGFRLEGVVDYRTGDLDVGPGINGGLPADIIGADSSTALYAAHADGNMQVWDLMLNGLYDFNRDGTYQPYVGVGIGAATVSAKARNLAAATGFGGSMTGAYGANGFSDEDSGIAYQALAGIGYSLSDKLKLDLGYRYYTIDNLDFKGVGPLGERVNYTADYQDHSVTVGLRWNFGAPAPVAPPPP
ncbi:MAG: porin family protein, partial [Alphaproteobacteria bacterium]|nr:porin family protein [Alphaproteobacteria bacterium]